MKVYLGGDHQGFELKEKLFAYLSRNGYDVEDVGATTYDPDDDYPQFAFKTVTKVLGSDDNDARGILVCGGGQGMAIAANRVRGIRAVVVWNEHEAKMSRVDNDANVLSLPAHTLDEKAAIAVIETWLNTQFSKAPRHVRRLQEIEELYG